MSHLSQEQRCKNEVLLQERESKSSIAKIIRVDISVVYSEIKRNCDARSGIYKSK
ncbi:MAG TPA: hypothetical protein VFF35_07490 [Bacteroidia bacterium]|nr:hypothetical protein [Bacteroidia bacterium]